MDTPPPPPGFELVGGAGAVPPPPPGFEPVTSATSDQSKMPPPPPGFEPVRDTGIEPHETKPTRFNERQRSFREQLRTGGPGADLSGERLSPEELQRQWIDTGKGLAKGLPATLSGGLVGDVEQMGRQLTREFGVKQDTVVPTTQEGGYLGPKGLGVMEPAKSPQEAVAMSLPAMLLPGAKGLRGGRAAEVSGFDKPVVAMRYKGKIYEGKPGEHHADLGERIGVDWDNTPAKDLDIDLFKLPSGEIVNRQMMPVRGYPHDAAVIYPETPSIATRGAQEARAPTAAPEVPPPPKGFEPVASPLGAAAATERAPGAASLPPTYPEAVAAVGSRIGETPKPSLMSKDLVAEVVDDLSPVSRAERAAGADQAALDPTTSPYQALRLTRGSGGKVEQMLQHGTFDFNTLENKGGSFVDAVKPIRNQKDEFKAYLLANRDLELEQRGISTGVNSSASQVVVKDAPPAIKQAAEKLGKYQDDVLQYAIDAGIVSKDAAADMRAMNRAYVPFYRVMDDTGTAPFPSRGFQTGRPTSMIKGSERQIVDPLESVIKNTQTFIQKAEHNRALKVLEDFSNTHPEAGILKPVKAPVRPIEIQSGEIARIADDLGVPEAALGNETHTIFRRSDKELPPNVIQIFHDGKPKLYEVDPEIARAIKGMDNVDMGNFLRILGAPSRMLRAGVVLDPTYMARNFIRDQFSAGIQSKNNYYPVYDFAKGLGSRIAGGPVGTIANKHFGRNWGQAYQDWLKAGGAQASLMSLDRSSAAVKLASKYGQDPTLGGRVKNVITAPLDVLRVMSQVVDEATRIGEYMQATKGKTDLASKLKGGFESREVTTDFSKHGRDPTIRALSQISEFMNAQIQGTAREAQAVKRQTGKTAAVTAAAITLPSVYLWIQNHNDPRYKNAPSWEKDAYWLIMPANPKQEPWRIPKPWVFGMLGGSLVERSLDKFVDSKPEAYKGFGDSMGGALIPNFVPTIAKPIYENWANRSSFTGAPIESERLKNLPPSERYTETTPEIYKKGAKIVAGIAGENAPGGLSSPQKLQNYVRAWGGTLGQNAVLGVDKALTSSGALKAVPAPARGLLGMPVIRAFISEYPSAGAQPIRDFYEKNTEIEQKFNARKEALRRGDAETAKTYADQVGERTQGIKRSMDALWNDIRKIRRDPVMTSEAKTEAIKGKYLDLLDRSQRGLEIIRQDEARRELRQKPATEYKGP